MNILMVSPYMPTPTWGAGLRTYYLARALAARHRLSFFAPEPVPGQMADSDFAEHVNGTLKTFAEPRWPPKRLRQLLSAAGNRAYAADAFHSSAMKRALDDLLRGERFDAVVFESVYTAGVEVPTGTKVIIDQHNIEHELLLRMAGRETSELRGWFKRREGRLLRPVELDRCRRADLVLVTSERERAILAEQVPGSAVEVVPNGVDVHRLRRDPAGDEIPGRLIFIGSMNYYPNPHAVLHFARHCWPLVKRRIPNATWQIIGGGPPPAVQKLAEMPGVEVLGAVPDVLPHLHVAQVAIAPLLSGSGTRLKILEALAMEKAVVSTALGCEGIAVTPGEHLVVADTPEATVEAVVGLFGDEARRRRLGRAGRALVEADYSWERCGDDLLAALDRMREPEAVP